MTTTNSGADVLASLPDLPRWVAARGMLLARRGLALDVDEACRVVCGRKDHLVVPVTIALSAQLETVAMREVPGGSIVLQDIMLPAARYFLPEWNAEPATVFTLPDDKAKSWPLPEWPTAPLTTAQLESAEHVPGPLRDRLVDASTRMPVWGASLDGRPAAFGYASLSTEAWFEISVETLEPARRRGLGRAAAMGIIVDGLLRGHRPVLSCVRGNEAANGLARRLGFEPVDMLWVLTRPA
jgi:hypothetical protein